MINRFQVSTIDVNVRRYSKALVATRDAAKSSKI